MPELLDINFFSDNFLIPGFLSEVVPSDHSNDSGSILCSQTKIIVHGQLPLLGVVEQSLRQNPLSAYAETIYDLRDTLVSSETPLYIDGLNLKEDLA